MLIVESRWAVHGFLLYNSFKPFRRTLEIFHKKLLGKSTVSTCGSFCLKPSFRQITAPPLSGSDPSKVRTGTFDYCISAPGVQSIVGDQ